MPFERSFSVSVQNNGSDAVRLDVSLTYEAREVDGLLTFGAHRNERSMDGSDDDFEVLDMEGRGHVVGTSMVLCCTGDCSYGLAPRFGHLEGDERIWIDGAQGPQLHGTGSEDYFNSGYYYAGGPYQRPTHGMPYQLDDSRLDNGAFDCTTQYRLHITDPIPFQRSIRFTLEHGPVSDFATYFTSVAYFYRARDPPA